MPRCATADTGDSPMKPGPPGQRTKTTDCSHLSNKTEMIPGRPLPPTSKVNLPLCRPNAEATKGSLCELPQARPAQVRMDHPGGPITHPAYQPAWKELGGGGGGDERTQPKPDQEPLFR